MPLPIAKAWQRPGHVLNAGLERLPGLFHVLADLGYLRLEGHGAMGPWAHGLMALIWSLQAVVPSSAILRSWTA